MTVQNEKMPVKTRRGVLLCEENPFIVDAIANTNEGIKRKVLKNKDGSQLMVTSESGEVVGPAGFWQMQEVDKTQFVKLYVNGVRAFRGLSSAGGKMFEILYMEMQKNVAKDRVYLSFPSVDQEVIPISESTYMRGMRELVAKKFIAATPFQGLYWVNLDYMWNGDRLAYVKEYRIKRDAAADKAWNERVEAAREVEQLENQLNVIEHANSDGSTPWNGT